jgi:hypothetical protein
MTTPATLPAIGTIGLTQISGDVGKLIKIGQWMNGQGFREWEHSFLLGPNETVLEAEPGGARIANVSEYDNATVYWCTAIAAQFTEEKLAGIWGDAVQKYGPGTGHKTSTGGVGYSFLDYAALAAHRLRIPVPGLKRYIASTGHMICSVLDDQEYADEGCNLFAGTWPGYVTPLGLYNLDAAIRREIILRPAGLAPARGPRKVRM